MRSAPFIRALPLASIALAAFGPLPARVASAQSLPSIDARTWRPSTDPAAGLVLEPTMTPAAWAWNVGALLNYAYRPVSLNDPTLGSTTLRPVESQLGLDLVAGLGIGHHLSLGLDLPLALYQTGTNPLPASVSSNGELPISVIGDLALNAKASFFDNSGGGFGLAALATVTIPTGDPESFMGEGSATVGVRLVAEYTLIVASVQASLGYTLRTDDRTWPADSSGITYGDSIPWSVAIGLKPDIFKIDKGHRQRWELGFHGWLPAGPVAPFAGTGAAQLSPAIVSLGDRIEIGHYRDSYLLVGVEAGMTDANAVGSPIFRGILGIGWAPRNHDMDNDGVPDDVDQCPELPEDKDGFEDRDGCPEIDNDDDGVLDKEDACPNVPGVPSTDPKKNGCPNPTATKTEFPTATMRAPTKRGWRATTRRPTAVRSPAIAMVTESLTRTTAAPINRRTRTASRTTTAAPIRTTTATGSPTPRTPARTYRGWPPRTQSSTGAPTPIATETRSTTKRTSVPTRRRHSTACRTTTGARTLAGSRSWSWRRSGRTGSARS